MEIISLIIDGDSSTEQKAEEEKDEYPRLILYFQKNRFYNSVLVADGVKIETQAMDIPYAVVVLIAAYYVFNIEYPMWWQNFLGLLQHIVVEEKYKKASTSGTFGDKLDKIEDLMKQDGPAFDGRSKQM